MSQKQAWILNLIRDRPGLNKAQVTRREWAGPGHAASYARINRLIRSGRVITGPAVSGRGIGLYPKT